MRRVLPDNMPTLDYELWRNIFGPPVRFELVKKDERQWLAGKEFLVSSEKSVEWMKEGRDRSRNDTTKVFDFISLSKFFDLWFDHKKYFKQDLDERIKKQISRIPGAELFFEGEMNTLLDLNWTILARVIGAAVANYGHTREYWGSTGLDAKDATKFWNDLKRQVAADDDNATINADDLALLAKGFDRTDWVKIGDQFRERGDFNPDSEILRSYGHRASSPFWHENHLQDRYYANPLAMKHHKLLFNKYRNMKNPGVHEDVQGQLTLEVLGDALWRLREVDDHDRFADFALKIHGMCAFHIVRTDHKQQKIGLHLFSNLVARKMSRDVGGSNVPDIAKSLKTGFGLAKVLLILSDKNHKIIEWNSVEKEIVDKIVDGLK